METSVLCSVCGKAFPLLPDADDFLEHYDHIDRLPLNRQSVSAGAFPADPEGEVTGRHVGEAWRPPAEQVRVVKLST